MRLIDPVRLYPSSWQARYGDEMAALLEDRPPTRRDRVDLARGALDAWLHPPIPSRVPSAAAMLGGGVWTAMSMVVLLQPVPADWPGYLIEVIPAAIAAAACLLVAVVGCAMRLGDAGGRTATVATSIAALGYGAWIVMLAGTLAGVVEASWLAATQAVAMVATATIGILLVRHRDEPIGALVALAPLVLLVPSAVGWLAFGTAWTAVGLVGWFERSTRIGPAGFA
jgi:hypothetical protein